MNYFQELIPRAIDFSDLLTSLLLSFIFALIISWLNQNFLISTTGRKNARGYLVLIPTVVLIFSVIKSSVALSLGTVGAMSIIRFRTPIKDPDELISLFLSIAVGIGLGAGHPFLTTFAFSSIVIAIICYGYFSGTAFNSGFYLSIQCPRQTPLDSTTKILKQRGLKFKLKRFSDLQSETSFLFVLNPTKNENLDKLRSELLKEMPPGSTVEFMSLEL